MFEIEEDFIVDEGFLEDVFKAEAVVSSQTSEKEKLIKPPPKEKSNKCEIKVVKAVRERKFPGPAGLLPERQGNTSFTATDDLLQELDGDGQENSFKVGEILSQSTSALLEKGTWAVFLQTMGSEGDKLVETINIESVKSRAKHARCIKVPFLAVRLHQLLESNSPDPSLVFKDSTGEVYGTIHRDFWEKYGDDLVLGSVMVLRNVGLITIGTTARRHYINVTEKNVASIYTTHKSHDVRTINIKPILRGDAHKILEEWRAPPKPSAHPVTPAPPPPLFTKIGSNPPPRRPPPQNQAYKRPRLESRPQIPFKPPRPQPQPNQSRPSQPPRSSGSLDDSIVESLLDGIDTDSLFGEF